eukprot:CAMPEP_0176360280 /NCGR_PEP_ID=MMETSP0126-20121128/16983_1 /TAXON_ID=141414 ORGANISM="Strombidinopsis acuminatum, Strain SPMC142" /NCGR_SAMPLE_ID=MMETSP0126 /ASSEMBLY_ACC=CAM_ASM_000229 /LENGTH=32 /DNA_ID= /DNA_START= /DNA_END= /DNA_ORIENTATION=
MVSMRVQDYKSDSLKILLNSFVMTCCNMPHHM